MSPSQPVFYPITPPRDSGVSTFVRQTPNAPTKKYPSRTRSSPARYRPRTLEGYERRMLNHPPVEDPFIEPAPSATTFQASPISKAMGDLSMEGTTGEEDEPTIRAEIRHGRAFETDISLFNRVQHLEKSERRLKLMLYSKMETLKELREVAYGASKFVAEAEIVMARMSGTIIERDRQIKQFRGWWLSDHYALGAALAQVPHSARDDLEDIATASRCRYESYRRDLGAGL